VNPVGRPRRVADWTSSKVVTVRLTPLERAALARLAERWSLTASEVVRELIAWASTSAMRVAPGKRSAPDATLLRRL
jgi:hypothetical protein